MNSLIFLQKICSKRKIDLYCYRKQFYYNKRNGYISELRNNYNEKWTSLIENTKINSFEDWKMLKEKIINDELNRNFVTLHSFDNLIMNYCLNEKKYNLANHYIEFLRHENGEIKLATISKYLKSLYYKNLYNLTDEKEILTLCEGLRKTYKILDSYTLESIAAVVSLTKEWKQCIDILKEITRTSVPSAFVYNAVVSASLKNNEEQLAWGFIDEMLDNDREPDTIWAITYINSIMEQTDITKIKKLLTFYAENNLTINKKLADAICEYFIKHNCSISSTKIEFNTGRCKCCNKPLSKLVLTNEEFAEIKNAFMQNVIVGKDIFRKSSPKELLQFKEFLSKIKPFDVVLDGLNIAYSVGTRKPPEVYGSLLSTVVSYFSNKGKSVLVLGRVHMKKWPKKYWDIITDKATVFLTENISQDDPYLLYCALNSGQDTIVVSRDLMRGHKFLLKNRRHKLLFERWLNESQYLLIRINKRGAPIFNVPLPYSVVPQKISNNWHIPYTTHLGKDDSYTNWLCIDTKQ